jgi:RNA polymerase sigma-70 factor (ECF subfamily)
MKTQAMKDRELVRQFIAGNPAAFERLFNRHKDRIYTYIFYIVKNEALADDIFQDTFIKVINSLKRGKYNEQGVFVSWVTRIAHNLTIDYFRKEKKMPAYSNDANEDYDIFNSEEFSDENIEDEMVKTHISSEVKKLIQELPEEQREVVLLRHYGELSFKEIAEKTGVSINTALGRMRYALINIRKLMEEKELNLTYY